MSHLYFTIFKGITQSKKRRANLVDLHIKNTPLRHFYLNGVFLL